MDKIIKNGTIITSIDNYKADIGIKDGKIKAIAEDLSPDNNTEIIDAQGLYVMPGGIDVHVHLELPFCGTVSKDDFENGTKAAACGGITTVIDYAIQQKGNSVLQTVKDRQNQADGKVSIDYSLHAGITDWKTASKEIEDLVRHGITSFKMFMVYKDMGWMADDGDLLQALETTVKTGTMLMVHAENDFAISMLSEKYLPSKKDLGAYGDILSRPDYTEYEAISRAILWSKVTGGRLYIVHMSTSDGANAVMHAQNEGVNVYAETCPHYLLLDESLVKEVNGHLYTPSPPLRKEKDRNRLWKGIQDHTIEVIGTDTCTFDTHQKALWEGDFKKLPFGLPGLETMIPIIHQYGVLKKRITLNRLVQLCSTNPAKLFGLYPQKGAIAIGSDADIIIFDPEHERIVKSDELQSNSDWSPYEGYRLKGWPVLTISRGKIVSKNCKYVGNKSHGRFIPRKTVGMDSYLNYTKTISVPTYV
ncbi:MAG: dihydropyrimidinase [Cyanobacteriota bacterium]